LLSANPERVTGESKRAGALKDRTRTSYFLTRDENEKKTARIKRKINKEDNEKSVNEKYKIKPIFLQGPPPTLRSSKKKKNHTVILILFVNALKNKF